LDGGSKTRFLPFLIQGAHEVVFGGPYCGGAPLALSVLGRHLGIRVTLFYAQRAHWHARQTQAQANGARIVQIRPGYMAVVQKRARDYADAAGAMFLPLGFDVPAAEQPFVAFMTTVRRLLGGVDEVWCAAGSGMLARCLGRAFPDSAVHAVTVGLASRHAVQSFGSNVTLHACRYRFEQECKTPAPFPTCANYDKKAWEIAVSQAKGRALFWNVLG